MTPSQHPPAPAPSGVPQQLARRRWLRQAALRHLARREHTRHELEIKLLTGLRRTLMPNDSKLPDHGVDNDELLQEVRLVLDELAQRGLQSDARSAEVLVQAKSARWGQRRLRMELQRRGVPRDLADPALARLVAAGATELARAAALWRRRFGDVAATPAERLRQMRWLAARGFASEVVRRVVGGEVADDEISPAVD